MPPDSMAPHQRVGYEWPIAIVFLYLWQIIVAVLAQYGFYFVFKYQICSQGCRPLKPEDAILILYQVFNFAVLVCIVAETTLCSHDKLTINIFLGCHIVKFVYIGVFLVQIIWGFNFNFKNVIEFVDFIAPLIFAFGSIIIGLIYAIIVKVRSSRLELRDETRPLLDGDRPRELPESQERVA